MVPDGDSASGRLGDIVLHGDWRLRDRTLAAGDALLGQQTRYSCRTEPMDAAAQLTRFSGSGEIRTRPYWPLNGLERRTQKREPVLREKDARKQEFKASNVYPGSRQMLQNSPA
jgi:hypothetical protein